MSLIPNKVVESNYFHKAWNKLIDYLKSAELQSNDEILVTKTNHGTNLRLVKKNIGNTSTVTTAPNVSYFAIESLTNSDYFKALPLTVKGSGSYTTCSFASASIYVAKHNFMRTSVNSEWIDGVTLSYSSILDNSRTATSGSYSEVQVTYPRYYSMTNLNLTGSNYTSGSVISGSTAQSFLNKWCVVKGAYVDNTGLAVGNNKIQWEEIGTRVWARRKVQ